VKKGSNIVKISKKIISILVSLMVITCISSQVFASDIRIGTTSQMTGSTRSNELYDLSISTSDSDVMISEPMTYEEIASSMANDEGISIYQAKKRLGKPNYVSPSILDIDGQFAKPSATAASYTYSYRTLSKSFWISTAVYNDYAVKVNYYCYTVQSQQGLAIITTLNASIDRSHSCVRLGFGGIPYVTTISKQFSGTLYYNMENCYTIYMILNCDFFNNGNTTFGTGLAIGVGESCTISFSVSYSSSWYAYAYKTGSIVTAH
jgi:hypothetical protein